MTINTKVFVQNCHYFNNGKMCPFEELGCKFLHVLAKNCKFGQRCSKRLCPLRHFEKEVNTIHDTEIDMDDEQCNTIDADSVVMIMNHLLHQLHKRQIINVMNVITKRSVLTVLSGRLLIQGNQTGSIKSTSRMVELDVLPQFRAQQVLIW